MRDIYGWNYLLTKKNILKLDINLNQILSGKRIYLMSVLVKDWNLPDMCLVCPFFSGQGCKVTMRLFPDWVNVATRPTGCPLSEYLI